MRVVVMRMAEMMGMATLPSTWPGWMFWRPGGGERLGGARVWPEVSRVASWEVTTLLPAPLWAVSWTLYQVAGMRSEMMMFSSSDLDRDEGLIQNTASFCCYN